MRSPSESTGMDKSRGVGTEVWGPLYWVGMHLTVSDKNCDISSLNKWKDVMLEK